MFPVVIFAVVVFVVLPAFAALKKAEKTVLKTTKKIELMETIFFFEFF